MQKGQILIWIIVGSLIAVVAGGVYLIRQNNKSRLGDITFNTSLIPPSQTPQPTSSNVQIDSNMYDQVTELNGFPVYPGSVFTDKKYYPKCEEGKYSGFSNCDVVTYTFESRDDFDQVNSFYKKDSSKSGWVCSGGAGSYAGPRDASTRTSCKKDGKNYNLDLNTNSVKTSISLNIPLSDYKGKYLNQ